MKFYIVIKHDWRNKTARNIALLSTQEEADKLVDEYNEKEPQYGHITYGWQVWKLGEIKS